MDREFNLGRAMVCEPIETVSGITVEFIAYRPTASSNKPVIVQAGDNILTYYTNGMFIDPAIRSPFDLRMKHTLRKIDWTKLPEDTVISTPEGDRHIAKCPEKSTLVLTYPEGKSSLTCGLRELEEHRKEKCYLVEQQPWTVWQGGECPLPDGLEFEYLIRDDPGQVMVAKESASSYLWEPNIIIYAYRLTGKVLDGWTL
jgi:hypothetical protein